MKWIGLTGGIACGKSTVKSLLLKNQLPVIDADQIVHDLSKVGERGYEFIKSTFGPSVLAADMSINRKKLGQLVFSDESLKNLLEQGLHPLVQHEVALQKQKYLQQNKKFCFYDVPLLFEKKLEKQFDAIITVYASPSIQEARLKQRNQMTDLEITQRLQAQLSPLIKIKNSTYCIDNSTHLQDLCLQVECLIARLKCDF